MKRWAAVLMLVWMVSWAGVSIWGACPAANPFSGASIQIQGPDPTGNAGYPLAVVGATGCPLTVDGTVGVNNFPATQPVSGTFWQATQPVSGTFWQATQPVSGTVTANQGTSPWVTGFGGVGQPVNATQAGTWTVQPGNTANTTAWKVDGSAVTQPVSGTVTANVVLPVATSVTLLSSAARTATTDSSSVSGASYRRFSLYVNITANTGAISIAPRLQIQDSISGNWFTVWTGSNMNSITTRAFLFADGAAGGSWTATQPFGIPGATFRFEMVHNNANSVTYSASADLMR